MYSTAPTLFTPCMQAFGELTMAVYASPGCQWSVSASDPWITVTANPSGTGLGTTRFRLSDNWDAPREGLLVVRGALPGQTATARVAQAGCVYWLSRDAIEFSAVGGPGGFDVIQESLPNTCGGPLQNACLWSAVADAPWMSISTAMPQKGDNPVAFTVAPNDGAARTGTITVRDEVVHIVQAGR